MEIYGFILGRRKLYSGGLAEQEWLITTEQGLFPLAGAFSGPAVPAENVEIAADVGRSLLETYQHEITTKHEISFAGIGSIRLVSPDKATVEYGTIKPMRVDLWSVQRDVAAET